MAWYCDGFASVRDAALPVSEGGCADYSGFFDQFEADGYSTNYAIAAVVIGVGVVATAGGVGLSVMPLPGVGSVATVTLRR